MPGMSGLDMIPHQAWGAGDDGSDDQRNADGGSAIGALRLGRSTT